jgi:Transglutaminase-like superfamily
MKRSLRISAVSNTFLFVRVFLFAAAVPHLMRLKPARLAAVLEPGSAPWAVDPDHLQRIAAYLQTAIERGGPLVQRGCLTLGLTRYYFFRRAGMDVSLHFGMRRLGKEKEFVGHCWLMRDGEPLLETKDPRPLYIEMYRISRDSNRKSVKTKAVELGGLTH